MSLAQSSVYFQSPNMPQQPFNSIPRLLAAIGSERGLYMAKSLQLVKAYLALMLMVA